MQLMTAWLSLTVRPDPLVTVVSPQAQKRVIGVSKLVPGKSHCPEA